MARLKGALRRNAAAMTALRSLGLDGAAIDRLHLGLKAPYRARGDGLETRDALCFPLLDDGLRPIARYGYLNLEGVTQNPHDPVGWGPGHPLVYRLGNAAVDAVAIVATDVVDAWLAWQLDRGEQPECAFVTRSQPGGWPAEWMSAEWWAAFRRVLLLPGRGEPDFIREIAPRIGRQLLRVRLPAPLAFMGDAARAAERRRLCELIADVADWRQEMPAADAATASDRLGAFAANPVNVAALWTGKHLYHPFVVERREIERTGRDGDGRVVHRWETMVLRSDGSLLTAVDLPSPRGAPAGERVLALSDGTRLLGRPVAARSGTWSLPSIDHFVRWRIEGGTPPFRPFAQLLAGLETFVRSRVVLPVDGHHLLAALYVALAHVHQIFDAIPLLLVVGPAGTGKSELGEALAMVGPNATVAGQLRAAGIIRLMDENRGLLVLDDMDGDGRAAITGTGELAQALKVSYKKSTARKPLADRGGRVRMLDFYGPKVISTIRGVDEVLGSRMLAIPTCAISDGLNLPGRWSEADVAGLRDELHCWTMASGVEVAEAYARFADGVRHRQAEIQVPLLTLAHFAGTATEGRLRDVLRDSRTLPRFCDQSG